MILSFVTTGAINYISATKNNSLEVKLVKNGVKKATCKALHQSVVQDFQQNLLSVENNQVTSFSQYRVTVLEYYTFNFLFVTMQFEIFRRANRTSAFEFLILYGEIYIVIILIFVNNEVNLYDFDTSKTHDKMASATTPHGLAQKSSFSNQSEIEINLI